MYWRLTQHYQTYSYVNLLDVLEGSQNIWIIRRLQLDSYGCFLTSQGDFEPLGYIYIESGGGSGLGVRSALDYLGIKQAKSSEDQICQASDGVDPFIGLLCYAISPQQTERLIT